ncbi:MAG: hypothetical protein WCS70_15065 [Verrucomicrobiota bacterium]
MKKQILIALAGVAALIPQFSHAQVRNEGLANDIIAARQKNTALMKQYAWNSRTELLINSAVKDIRIEQVMYGPAGTLQRTLLNDQPAAMPGGFLRKRIAEKEKADTEKYLHGLRTLLEEYTLSTGGKVIDFLSQAVIQAPDANGLLQFTGNGVVKPADTMTLSIFAPTKQTRQMTISTIFEGDQVNISATFKSLNSGLTYMAFGQVDVPAKNITVQLQNYDFINQNQ